MNVAGIEKALIGFALFDMWEASIKKANQLESSAGASGGSPLVAAAAQAFEAYIKSAEVNIGAQISGAAAYALNPGGNSASAITQQDIAPYLALNVMG